MINSWDDVLSATYRDDYHCEHFLVDVYRFLVGVDITDKVCEQGYFTPSKLKNAVKLGKPSQHCIVLMRDKNKAHVGLWHDNRVLHLTIHGAVLQPLEIANRGFKRVDFYAVV